MIPSPRRAIPSATLAAWAGLLLWTGALRVNADEPKPQPPEPNAEGPALLVHGGAGTEILRTVSLMPAVDSGWKALQVGGALDGAVAAAVALEDDPTFNAGTGSNIRMDGETVQMDAAAMNERGDFGAVAVIERVRNPILVARELMKSPHLMLAGEGATRFARTLGMPDYDPRTPESLQRYKTLQERMRTGELGADWKTFDWKKHWNFPKKLGDVLPPNDTIGAVARDGRGGFAAAVSTGGTSTTLYGRVGDVPIMGAGCYAGPAGAVCATGWGEYIVRETLSRRVYEMLAQGMDAGEAVRRGLALFPQGIGVGLIAVSATSHAAGANTTMAWAGNVGGKIVRADQGER